jgi:hypothetical protein
MARAMRNGKEPVFTYPTTPDATNQQDRLIVFTYEREYTRVDDEKRAFMENNHRTYKLLTLHCSPATVTAMKSMKDYMKCRKNQDGINLLALIQAVSFNKNAAEGTHGLLSVVRADKTAYLRYQKNNETPSEWIQSFQATFKLVEATGGKIGGGEHVFQYLVDLEEVDLTTLAADKLAEFKERATNMYQVLLCFDGIKKRKSGL